MNTSNTLCRILTVGLAALACGCLSSSNPYMVRDTPEYREVTGQVVGRWTVAQYERGPGAADFRATFDRAEARYDFEAAQATYSFVLSRGKLEEKLQDWQRKYPDLEVTDYTVVVTAPWSVSEDGSTLKLGDKTYRLEISGAGENFDGFFAAEQSRFEAANHAGEATAESSGGLSGLVALAARKIADKTVKQATGTADLFVELAGTHTYEFRDDGSLLLCGKGAAYRVDTESCEERMVLRRATL